jgi:hypothetical protein
MICNQQIEENRMSEEKQYSFQWERTITDLDIERALKIDEGSTRSHLAQWPHPKFEKLVNFLLGDNPSEPIGTWTHPIISNDFEASELSTALEIRAAHKFARESDFPNGGHIQHWTKDNNR